MKVEDVDACRFERWYPKYKKITFCSKILSLPPQVLDYIKCDGSLVLPKGCNTASQSKKDDYDSDSDTDWDTGGAEMEVPCFAEFDDKLKEAIHSLGGFVMPKLNWSSPRDAIWIAFNKCMKCSTLADIYLLLKSSEFIAHDLTSPYKDCEDNANCTPENYCLVLRQWSEINPGDEFRCFVIKNKLVAVSQRDSTNFYIHISKEKQSIIKDIKTFYKEYLEDFDLDSFVFDIVRKSKDSVKLVDLNPFGETTDPGLFEWSFLNELKSRTFQNTCGSAQDNIINNIISIGSLDSNREIQSDSSCRIASNSGVTDDNVVLDVIFKYVETNHGIQPNDMGRYSVPRDVVDVTTGSDPLKLIDMLKLQEFQTNSDSEISESE